MCEKPLSFEDLNCLFPKRFNRKSYARILKEKCNKKMLKSPEIKHKISGRGLTTKKE